MLYLSLLNRRLRSLVASACRVKNHLHTTQQDCMRNFIFSLHELARYTFYLQFCLQVRRLPFTYRAWEQNKKDHFHTLWPRKKNESLKKEDLCNDQCKRIRVAMPSSDHTWLVILRPQFKRSVDGRMKRCDIEGNIFLCVLYWGRVVHGVLRCLEYWCFCWRLLVFPSLPKWFSRIVSLLTSFCTVVAELFRCNFSLVCRSELHVLESLPLGKNNSWTFEIPSTMEQTWRKNLQVWRNFLQNEVSRSSWKGLGYGRKNERVQATKVHFDIGHNVDQQRLSHKRCRSILQAPYYLCLEQLLALHVTHETSKCCTSRFSTSVANFLRPWPQVCNDDGFFDFCAVGHCVLSHLQTSLRDFLWMHVFWRYCIFCVKKQSETFSIFASSAMFRGGGPLMRPFGSIFAANFGREHVWNLMGDWRMCFATRLFLPGAGVWEASQGLKSSGSGRNLKSSKVPKLQVSGFQGFTPSKVSLGTMNQLV